MMANGAGRIARHDVLAGSAQSLANSEDPHPAWVKEHYTSLDARVPLYEVKSRVQ